MSRFVFITLMLSFSAAFSLNGAPDRAVLLTPADAGAAKLAILEELLNTIGGVDEVLVNPARLEKNLPDLNRPPLPPGVPAGGHGGSHGHLMNEFILSIIEDRKPLVDIAMSLNMTVCGIIAHQSALKGGEWMKVPQYRF